MTTREAGSVLVIGGSGGMGRAIAAKLGSDGWRVGLLGRDARRLEQARLDLIESGMGTAIRVWTADIIRSSSEMERVAGEFEDWAGSLDAVVMAAGRLRGIGPIENVAMDAAWEDIEIALKGTAHVVRATLGGLGRSARASYAVLLGPGYNGELANATLYSAAQAGLARLIESFGKELEPSGMVVYGIYPGLSPTPFMLRLLESDEGRRWLPRFNEAFAEGKEVEATVGAELVSWLLSERPRVLSGRVIPALQTPELLALRLGRYAEDGNLGRLRLR